MGHLMNRQKKITFFLFISFAFFLSCSVLPQKFNTSFPTFKEMPKESAYIGVSMPGNSFALLRAKWFSNRIYLPEDSSHLFLGNLTDSLVFKTLQNNYKNINPLPKIKVKNWAEESIKLDEKIFIQGKFPAQNDTIFSEENKPYDYLILIHEWTLGADLDKNQFFDYSLKANEMDSKKQVKNLSIITSFTLWDNLKQIPLYSAVLNISDTANQKNTLDLISDLTIKITEQIPLQIKSGVQK